MINQIAFSGMIVTEPKVKSDGKGYNVYSFQIEQEEYVGPNMPKRNVRIGVRLKLKDGDKRASVLKLDNLIHAQGKYTSMEHNGVNYPMIDATSNWELGFSPKYKKDSALGQGKTKEDDDNPPF